jgi:hypothetical protein
MKPKFQQAYNALRTLGVPLFERDDQPGRFFISAEMPESDEWVSYWGGGRDWIFGVHPAVDATLRQFDLFAEWENPGCLVVCEG